MNWKPLQSWSLKSRVTLLTLSIFLIGVWSLAFYASGVLREDMQRQLGEQQFSTVSLLAVHVGEELESRLRALEAIAATISPVLLKNEAELQAQLENRPVLQMQFNGGIVAVRSDGTTIADVPLSMGRLGVNYMDRDYFAAALKEGKTSIGRPVRGKKLPGPIIAMAAPIKDRQGKVIGALAGTTDLSKPNFLDKITGSKYGNSGGYIIADRKHRLIVTASDKSRAMEELPAPGVNPYIDRRMQGNDGYDVLVTARGVEVLTSAKSVPVANWSVVASLPTEEAFAPIRAIRERMLLATTLLTLLAGILVWWTTWWMLRRQLTPMIAATRTLDSLSSGSIPLQPIPVTSKDEIGELIGGFNRLLVSLKQQGDELRASESRAKAIVDASPAPLAMNDDRGNITYLNKTFVRVLGYTLNDIPTLADWWRLAYPDPQYRQWIADSWQRALEEAKRTGSPFIPIECSIHCKDGSVRTFLVGATGLEEQFAGLHLVILYDITERKRADQALRESESQLLAIFQNSPIGIAFTRTADSTILEVNNALLQMFEYERDELIGKNSVDLNVFADPIQRVRGLQLLRERGSVNNFPLDYRSKSGKVLAMEVSARLLDFHGDPCLVTMMVDVSERRRHEKALQKLNQELEQRIHERTRELQIANDELESFSYSVSHDLRAPLRAIQGFSSLLETEYADKLDERSRDYFRRVRSGAVRMAALIDDLLNLSRISRQAMHHGVVDLSALAREAADELQSTVPKRRVEWIIAPDLRAEGDSGLLRVVLQNLIGNAWKYSSKRETARIEMGVTKWHDREAFFVRDNGEGFDMAYADKLFGAFQRLHSTEAFPGTGIGLATAARIIRRHGGTVGAEGKVHEGATFYFTL